jgi:signal transduction histidine kinase
MSTLLTLNDALFRLILDPYFALNAGLALVVVGIILLATARMRANRHFEMVLNNLNVVTTKLNEAEKLGHFGSFTWDFEGSSSYWSQEMFNLFGMVPEQTPPTIEKMLAQVHESDRVRTREAWQKAKAQPGVFEIKMRIASVQGTKRYLHVQGKTVLTGERTVAHIDGVMHDVSKEMEVDRAKTEFVSLASHQLKTPLTTISWLTEALLAGKVGELREEQQTYLTDIYHAEEQMVEIVNDLLNVSRIELGKLSVTPEDLDVSALVQDVIAAQQHAADQARVQIRFMCAVDVPHLSADRIMLREIVQNLISNAIKYTRAGGFVECEITVTGAKRESIYIRVSDTGIGIPKEEQGRIFEKLHRASNAQILVPDGTGLGLYMVKNIVEYIGGAITFESIEGTGTTFYVSVPMQWQASREKDAKNAVFG